MAMNKWLQHTASAQQNCVALSGFSITSLLFSNSVSCVAPFTLASLFFPYWTTEQPLATSQDLRDIPGLNCPEWCGFSWPRLGQFGLTTPPYSHSDIETGERERSSCDSLLLRLLQECVARPILSQWRARPVCFLCCFLEILYSTRATSPQSKQISIWYL